MSPEAVTVCGCEGPPNPAQAESSSDATTKINNEFLDIVKTSPLENWIGTNVSDYKASNKQIRFPCHIAKYIVNLAT